MTLQARQARIESSGDLRDGVRRRLLLDVSARASGASVISATVHDISDTGLLIESDLSLSLGDVVEVELPQAQVRSAEVVWLNGRLAGCRFVERVTSGTVSAALLRGSFASLAPREGPPVPLSSARVASPAPDDQSSELSSGVKAWIVLALSSLLWAALGGVLWMLS